MASRAAHVEPGLLPTTVVGSYPQPDWLIDRERLTARLPPRVRARELWRVTPSLLEQAQDDATLPRHPRSGTRRHRHRHRRRDAARELFQPLRDRARRRRHRQPRRGDRPHRPREPGAAHRRADRAPPRRSRCATSSSCVRTRTGAIKITLPGPFTHGAAGSGRLLRATRRARDGLRRRGQRGDPRPVGRRRRRRPDRRALPAGAARTRRGIRRSRRSTARSPAIDGHDGAASLLRLRRDRARPSERRLRVPAASSTTRSPARSRSRPRSRSSISPCSQSCRARRSCSA